MAGYPLEQQDDAKTQDPLTADAATAGAITVVPPAPTRASRRPRRWPWVIAAGGLVGALAGVGGWLWLRRPPSPYILNVTPTTSRLSVAQQDPATVDWQIAHPNQIQTLELRTYTDEGLLVGEPAVYDFAEGVPVALLPYCATVGTRLTCTGVPTGIRQPGQYRSELTLLAQERLDIPPKTATSSLIRIDSLPRPTVVELAPTQVIYSEAGTQVTGPRVPPAVTEAGVRLSWIINNPQTLQDVLLVAKQEDGTVLGGRRYSLRSPDNPELALPEALQPFCQLQPGRLVCQGVPTGMVGVGKYRFELTAVSIAPQDDTEPAAQTTEVVQIQPRPTAIVAFTVNGQPADPRYLIPVDQGDQLPGVILRWAVQGGSTTRVELLPSPGSVGLEGTLPLPLSPTGTTTVTLRVSDGTNPPLVRAVTFETFDPTPNPQPVLVPTPVPQSEPSQPSSSQPSSPSQPSQPTPPAPLPADQLQQRIQDAQPDETRTWDTLPNPEFPQSEPLSLEQDVPNPDVSEPDVPEPEATSLEVTVPTATTLDAPSLQSLDPEGEAPAAPVPTVPPLTDPDPATLELGF